MFIWKFLDKLIIHSSLQQNNKAVKLITKLTKEMKYNQDIYIFYQRLNQSLKEELCQKLGYIMRK